MMISRKTVASFAFAAATVAVLMTGSASAQGMVPDQRTYFTFSAPVQLPGVTLPAGKYTFRLLDSQANRHVVQVFNADGTKIFATIMAIPAQRNDIAENPEIQFLETPADVPAAVDVWWYPGTKTGHEFVYPKDTAAKWAKAQSGSAKVARGETAPATMTFAKSDAEETKAPQPPIADTPASSTSSASRSTPPVASDVRADSSMSAPNAPRTTEPRAGEPRTTEPRRAESRTSAARTSEPRTSLPHTASLRPSVGGIGLLALFAGLALFFLRRRHAA